MASLFPNNVWPHHGVFVKERIAALGARPGYRVRVVAPVPYFPALKITHRWRYSQIAHSEVIDGLEVFHPRYVMIPKVAMALQGLFMFLGVRRAVGRLGLADAEIVDAHYVYPDGLAGVLLGRALGKPVVVTARGSDINVFQHFPVIRRWLRYTLTRADGVIAVSGALKQAICGLGVPPEQVTVVPNGVDPAKFRPTPRDAARATLNVRDRRVVLSVGNLTENKGVDLVLRAAKLVRARGRDTSLLVVIAGDGAIRRDLERLAADLGLANSVRFLGDVPHQELPLWYNAADLLCLASAREGWPNVILESLACGTPVVATAVGGVPEILVSDQLGVLTERSEEGIARALWDALQRPWDRDVIVAAARRQTWDATAARVGGVLQDVAARFRSRRGGSGDDARAACGVAARETEGRP